MTLLGRARVGRGARIVRLWARLLHRAARAHLARGALELARRRLLIIVLLVVAVVAALEVEVRLGGAWRGSAHLGSRSVHYTKNNKVNKQNNCICNKCTSAAQGARN